MQLLAIETSCDETSLALLESIPEKSSSKELTYTTHCHITLSQAQRHAEYGGVMPGLAKREHGKNLVPLLEQALAKAQLPAKQTSAYNSDDLDTLLQREPELLQKLQEFLSRHSAPNIDAIAVTVGPGLEPALWVGVNFAQALARLWNIPIIPVNHMEGHILSALISSNTNDSHTTLNNLHSSFVAMLVSGGHTQLVNINGIGAYNVIGETRDDAVGEAYDKVARLLDLPYPGGPEIAKLAERFRQRGIENEIQFTPPMLQSDDYDFSYSGIKTSVRYMVQNYIKEHGELTDEVKQQIAAAFEDAVVISLTNKAEKAIERYKPSSFILAGGVAANTYLQNKLREVLEEYNVELLVPPMELTGDNALMIGLVGLLKYKSDKTISLNEIEAEANLSL